VKRAMGETIEIGNTLLDLFCVFEHDLVSQKGTIDDGDSGKDVIIIRNSQV